MPRLTITGSALRISSQILRPSFYRIPARTASQSAGESHKEDHVVNKTDGNDVHSETSQDAMQQKKDGKEGSQAISQKDERGSNKKAEEDHPEAPRPVIGMNDERAQKGQK